MWAVPWSVTVTEYSPGASIRPLTELPPSESEMLKPGPTFPLIDVASEVDVPAPGSTRAATQATAVTSARTSPIRVARPIGSYDARAVRF